LFGTSEFAVPVLNEVAERHEVVGVVTQPDRPAGRGHKLTPTPVKRAAEARGLRVLMPEKLKPFADEVRALDADAFVVASYGKIVPQALLDVVPIAFNVHPSLLPLYRGATPLQSAIRDGRTETGVTIIAMDAGMDTGDILVQERTPIGERETYGELHDRTAELGARLLLDAIERYENGTLERTPQSATAVDADEIASTLTRPLRKEDLTIDWSRHPAEVVNHVRSLSPAPLARTTAYDEPIKVIEARVVPAAGGFARTSPPSPMVVGNALRVCSEPGQWVDIIRLIAPNRGPMTGEQYARSRMARAVQAP